MPVSLLHKLKKDQDNPHRVDKMSGTQRRFVTSDSRSNVQRRENSYIIFIECGG